MKRLLPVLMGFALLLLSSTEGWSLPSCPGSPTSDYNESKTWTDCFGTHIYSDPDKFIGERKFGAKYIGEWKNDKSHGQGTETYADGYKYVGEFKDGKYHGQGTYTGPDGTTLEGIWENGKFLYAK